ncbi:MAG TPA: alpha/beta family hydrolase [Candidatus Binatia bacterium]|nr:alpha/beta family hydrolase [Candidatus Binatia bacterium]
MSNTASKPIRFSVNEKAGTVSGLLVAPQRATILLVLAHGAGAGVRHQFMEHLAKKLDAHGIATFRYQFPYMEKGLKRPDNEAILTATVRAAVTAAREQAPRLVLFAGGKSMGGRMTSLAVSKEPIDAVRGLVFFGFPLHAAGRPGAERGKHLYNTNVPMLFIQGSRDKLADLRLLEPVCKGIGKAAELLVVEGGDHSFHMLKSAGRSDDQVLDEVARKAATWMAAVA